MIKNSVAVATLLAVTASMPAGAEPQHGGTINVAISADIRSTDPGINRDAYTDTVMHHVAETLVGYRDDLSVGPALAESWTTSDDGRTYTFTLREGALFHNGETVTSEDVKWSWERRMDPAMNWACLPYFDGSQGLEVTDVETPDPRTVVFTLAEPNALFLAQLANFQCNAATVHPDSVAEDGSWKEPIGSGPYRLKEWRKGEYVLLERFDDYVPLEEPKSGYAGARIAYADQVRFMVIPEVAAQEAALYAGEIDLLPNFEAQRMGEAEERGITLATTPGLSWTAALIQTTDPLLSDVRMRRAIAHALDMEQVAAARTNGLSERNPSAVPRSSAFFDDGFLAWPAYDPAKARALLQEAGYNGEQITIQTNRRYPGMYENAVFMQAMLAAAGIKAELTVLDWATQLDNYLNGDFQIQSFGYSARLDPTLLYGILLGDKEADPTVQWDDEDAYALYLDTMKTTEPAERKRLFKAIHERMAGQVPILGMYYEPVVDGAAPRLKDYAAWPADKPRLWGAWIEE